MTAEASGVKEYWVWRCRQVSDGVYRGLLPGVGVL